MAAAIVTFPTTTVNPLSSVIIDAPLSSDIRRNDWVMLINRIPGPGPIALRTNLAFARVSNLYNDEANESARLTLDGPNFQFTDPAPPSSPTFIVHLRNVVAVFPRTIKLETISTWNVSD